MNKTQIDAMTHIALKKWKRNKKKKYLRLRCQIDHIEGCSKNGRRKSQKRVVFSLICNVCDQQRTKKSRYILQLPTFNNSDKIIMILLIERIVAFCACVLVALPDFGCACEGETDAWRYYQEFRFNVLGRLRDFDKQNRFA